jgi:hypothetical protein
MIFYNLINILRGSSFIYYLALFIISPDKPYSRKSNQYTGDQVFISYKLIIYVQYGANSTTLKIKVCTVVSDIIMFGF